ncbi:centromere protein M isoform X3 [Macaca nemestrina]|uniref:centromere protein M isoform X3 n=1 Tax=Macaca nemestrina TaxID=9545 RepID=UPI0039B83CCC
MSVLRPLDKLPSLNSATILLVGTEDALLQQLADSMLKEDCASELKVHLAKSLPLPSSVNRPRIDLIVFVVNLHSKYRITEARASAFSVVKFCSLVCFLTLAWPPQPPEHRGVPAPCGCQLLLGEGGRLSGHHGAAPGAHAADLRWPRARCLSSEPAVPAEKL